jgi:hypothetical protein
VLLKGIVQGYKESEKLVCEIFSSFHDLLECMDIADIEHNFVTVTSDHQITSRFDEVPDGKETERNNPYFILKVYCSLSSL